RPLSAVPLPYDDRPVLLLILAAYLHLIGEALHAQLLRPLVGEVEVLEAPADLLAGHGLVPVLGHRGADGLDGEHRVHDAAIVKRLAHLLLLPGALALVVDVLHDLLEDLEARARRVEGGALVALGAVG